MTDIVWNPKKQSMLIDSMYRGFYIPPVVFSVHWDTTSQAKVRLCVDGKQRLTAISGFVAGRVCILAFSLTQPCTLTSPSFRSHVRISTSVVKPGHTGVDLKVTVRYRPDEQEIVLVQTTEEEERVGGTPKPQR